MKMSCQRKTLKILLSKKEMFTAKTIKVLLLNLQIRDLLWFPGINRVTLRNYKNLVNVSEEVPDNPELVITSYIHGYKN